MPFKDKKKRRTYMKDYMKDYRRLEREAIQEARRVLGLNTRVRKTQKKPQKKKVKGNGDSHRSENTANTENLHSLFTVN